MIKNVEDGDIDRWSFLGRNSPCERIGKAIAMVGVLVFSTYLIVRMYIIYRGTMTEFYGFSLFQPDRIFYIFIFSTVLILIGAIVIFINGQISKKRHES